MYISSTEDGSYRSISTVNITGAHALKILSGDNSALIGLRTCINDPSPAMNDVGLDMLGDVIHSPGLARILAHSCASASELTTAAILDNLPLWLPSLRGKKILTPVTFFSDDPFLPSLRAVIDRNFPEVEPFQDPLDSAVHPITFHDRHLAPQLTLKHVRIVPMLAESLADNCTHVLEEFVRTGYSFDHAKYMLMRTRSR
ncbi:hypothetical protein D9619_012723 [Psilocybe cf. subviscida]|uniref:Uncharacterized protein n=1 Tax=Psilocybe cf. subviscida TaxID=2480587 RepID=A0A8H5ARZ0_9AGAR|nr:hypothetical protein D9619_012723 [Psilocybe cf. subviscida]